MTTDEPKSYVVITGNFSEGFEFHGPFDSFDEAAESIPGSTFGSWISVMWPPLLSPEIKSE